MTIAITGASGQLGHLVIEKLKQKVASSDIIALVRTPEKSKDLGVALRQADYTAPASLEAALTNVDTLLLISSSEVGQRTAQHRNVIEAAKKTGVKHIVYTSLLHADTSPLSLAPEHVETEAMLKDSGLTYTILRNGWYTENYTASIPGALAGGAFIGSAGKGRIASAPRADYAEAAVAVLTGNGHEGKTYELAGDIAWTLDDLAAEISKQTGRDIPYKNLPETDYASALQGVGLPEGLAAALASWDTDAGKDALFHDGKELSRLIGRPTTTLSEAVAAVIKQ
ncbi:MAG: SDR family oxidoreductase [Alcaligenaceae bacterium]|nr:SDR family oxidoreductase [Alcaligenaceae bacterium]